MPYVYKVDLENQLKELSISISKFKDQIKFLKAMIDGKNASYFKFYYEKSMIEQLLKREVKFDELEDIKLKKEVLVALEKILAGKMSREFMLQGVLNKHKNDDKGGFQDKN